MNTEQRVLAMLNKTKEIKLAKKENLGAIEDAIKEAQDNISAQVANIDTILYNLINETDQIVSGIQGFANQAKDMISRAQSFYDEYEAEYLRLSQELDALGLNYEGLDVSTRSDFKDAINYANTIASIDL